MYLLLAGNDTLPISVWRGGGMRSAECRSLSILRLSTAYLEQNILQAFTVQNN